MSVVAASFKKKGGMPPELDQPGLAGVQLQPELREPAAKLCHEPLVVLPVLEPDSVFFFSSRSRHTTSYGDWSSDVCSSDLRLRRGCVRRSGPGPGPGHTPDSRIR